MTGLGDQLLATPEGVAFLACGAAGGRLVDALEDPGLTLCLAAHALGEVARGTDGGRLAAFTAEPGPWLLDAAATVDEHDTSWWSTSAHGTVLRHVEDGLADVEVLDARGLRRSAAEEARAHLDGADGDLAPLSSPRRCRLDEAAPLVTVDGPQDVTDELSAVLGAGPAGPDRPVQLTLRGALTVPRDLLERWPWRTAGVLLPDAGTTTHQAAPREAEPLTVHDYDWPPIGRPTDPRLGAEDRSRPDGA